VFRWLRSLDRHCQLQVCPVDYSGQAPFGRYLNQLGRKLHADILLFYTGPEICSPAITAKDARQFTDAAFHTPLIWDNYPVNDLAMQSDLHLGPVTGRSQDLQKSVKGILANPMNLAEASKIPLFTLAEYWCDPAHYQPLESWDQALQVVAGVESAASLRLIADNTTHSFLQDSGGEKLAELAHAALTALESGVTSSISPDVQALQNYLSEIDEATYHLKFRMGNLALRNNLLPWIEVLEHWMWMARFALKVVDAIEQDQPYLNDLKRVHEYQELIRNHPKFVPAQSLFPLIDYTLSCVEQDQRRRVSRDWLPSVS
jgi:hyaluronoglucosaminidase